jgi:hypothetical protein
MGRSSYVVGLIKFVQEREHAETFINGDLFCMPWVSFKGMEDKQRGDKLELATSKLKTQAYLNSINRLYDFWLEDSDEQYSPVFCMYSMLSRKRKSSTKLRLKNEKLKEFGNYGVVINNIGVFLDRINHHLSGFSYGLVDYIDFDTMTEETLLTHKTPILKKDLTTFKHQREFRIYNTHYAITNEESLDNPTIEIIRPNEFGAAFFSIRNISDIAEIYSMDDLFHGVDVSVENSISKNRMSKLLWWDGTGYQNV